jgi:hypothetical protein
VALAANCSLSIPDPEASRNSTSGWLSSAIHSPQSMVLPAVT